MKNTFFYRILSIILLLHIINCTHFQNNKFTSDFNIKESKPLALENLHVNLTKIFSNNIPQNIALEYDKKLGKYFEKEFDGKKIDFITTDKMLKVKITLNESFKIIEEDLYCREYSQNVSYLGENIKNVAVACRISPNIWKNLILLTK